MKNVDDGGETNILGQTYAKLQFPDCGEELAKGLLSVNLHTRNGMEGVGRQQWETPPPPD